MELDLCAQEFVKFSCMKRQISLKGKNKKKIKNKKENDDNSNAWACCPGLNNNDNFGKSKRAP